MERPDSLLLSKLLELSLLSSRILGKKRKVLPGEPDDDLVMDLIQDGIYSIQQLQVECARLQQESNSAASEYSQTPYTYTSDDSGSATPSYVATDAATLATELRDSNARVQQLEQQLQQATALAEAQRNLIPELLQQHCVTSQQADAHPRCPDTLDACGPCPAVLASLRDREEVLRQLRDLEGSNSELAAQVQASALERQHGLNARCKAVLQLHGCASKLSGDALSPSELYEVAQRIRELGTEVIIVSGGGVQEVEHLLQQSKLDGGQLIIELSKSEAQCKMLSRRVSSLLRLWPQPCPRCCMRQPLNALQPPASPAVASTCCAAACWQILQEAQYSQACRTPVLQRT
jgi:hypothetical protein